MSPEIELLLCCLRTPTLPQTEGRVTQLLQAALNWDVLLALAQWHRVTPLFYWHIKQGGGWEKLGDEVRSHLSQQFQQNLQNNFLLTTILLKIMGQFQAQDIRAIPFKGVILAAQVYGNLGLRQVSDIDILVEKSEVAIAQKLLQEAGFFPAQVLTPPQQVLRLKSNYEDVWLHPESQTPLDLHWNLLPPFFPCRISVADLLSRSQPYTIGKSCLPSLDPVDLLLVLCVNGSKDGWLELQRLCDVFYCLQKYPHLDGGELLQRATSYDCLRMVLLGLSLTQLLFHQPLPVGIKEAIECDRMIPTLTQTIYQRFLTPTPPQLSLLERAYFPLQLQPGWLKKLMYCAKLVLPINERDLESIHLPPLLFPLYYPLRLLRLMAKHARDVKRNLFC